MFTKEGCGVEIYQVGKRQIMELLGAYADIDEAVDFWVSRGFERPVAALVMARKHDDDCYGEPCLLSWVTCERSVREILSIERERDDWYGEDYIYEVWYISDDQSDYVDTNRYIAKPNRYYYVAVHDYGIDFCNDVHYLLRFPNVEDRDSYVDDEPWDGRSYKYESVTRSVARGICPRAFADNVEVLQPYTGRDVADLDTILAVMASDGTNCWVVQPDGHQVFDCYLR